MSKSAESPARVILIAVALGAVAWLALGLGAARDEARGTDLAPLPGRLADSITALRDAREHNHDTAPLVLEAQAQIFGRRPWLAIPVLQDVVRREPANYQAWQLLGRAAESASQPGLAVQARLRAQILSPPVTE